MIRIAILFTNGFGFLFENFDFEVAQGKRFAEDVLHHVIEVVVPRTHLNVERRKPPDFFFTFIYQQLAQLGTMDELSEKEGELSVRE